MWRLSAVLLCDEQALSAISVVLGVLCCVTFFARSSAIYFKASKRYRGASCLLEQATKAEAHQMETQKMDATSLQCDADFTRSMCAASRRNCEATKLQILRCAERTEILQFENETLFAALNDVSVAADTQINTLFERRDRANAETEEIIRFENVLNRKQACKAKQLTDIKWKNERDLILANGRANHTVARVEKEIRRNDDQVTREKNATKNVKISGVRRRYIQLQQANEAVQSEAARVWETEIAAIKSRVRNNSLVLETLFKEASERLVRDELIDRITRTESERLLTEAAADELEEAVQ